MMRSSGVSRCSSFGGRTLWRRMVAILLLVIFIWTITVLNVTFIYTSNHPKKESAVLQVSTDRKKIEID